MAFADNIPDAANQIASDIAAIDDSLAHLKDCLEAICTGYSDSSTTSLEVNDVADATRVDDIKVNEDVSVTATATEINILDGVTSTTAELNILDGVTSTTAELNILDGVTSTTAELNIMDGVTATASEINTAADGISNPPLAGNSTAGQAQRSIILYIHDATDADEIKLSCLNMFNGDVIAVTDNIGKGETVDDFGLGAGGTYYIDIKASGLSGNCVGVLSSSIVTNSGGTAATVWATDINDGIRLYIKNAATGANLDTTVLVDTGDIEVHITYVTSA